MSNNSEYEAQRLLTLREVESYTSLKKSTIYNLISVERFPAPVPVTDRRRAWVASDVQAWVGRRIAQRRESEQLKKGEDE